MNQLLNDVRPPFRQPCFDLHLRYFAGPVSKWRLTWTSTSAITLAPKFTQGLFAWLRCEQPKSPPASVDALAMGRGPGGIVEVF